MNTVATIALTLYTVLFLGIVCIKGLTAMRKDMGFVFLLIVAGFLRSMATKPGGPSVTWDDYISDSGTHYATNGVVKTGVTFKWSKTRTDLPNTEPLYISTQPTNSATWTLAATTTVGGSPYTLTLASPDTYRYYVWHEWVPPSPVHTNGVWLGQILEKAKGDTGLNKLIIIINGELRQNGKVIAP